MDQRACQRTNHPRDYLLRDVLLTLGRTRGLVNARLLFLLDARSTHRILFVYDVFQYNQKILQKIQAKKVHLKQAQ